MEIHGLRMRIVEKDGLLGVFSFCLGGCLAVHGCKLVLKPDGRKLVIMPGAARETVHPITKEFRERLTLEACAEYEKRRNGKC